jgi:hypothetical protein
VPSLFSHVEAASESRKWKIGLALAAGAIVCLLVALISSVSGDKKQAAANRPDTASNNAISNSSDAPASFNFPELHFTSSDRLPTKLRIFRLGMSVAEAMAEDPELKNMHGDSGSGSQSPVSDPDAKLYQEHERERTGFDESADFFNGRLNLISDDVFNISPKDASLFNRNILVQLGKPDIEIYAGPSANVWVWIDGDVRIRYENNSGGRPTGARSVYLTMVIYPDVIKSILVHRSKPGRDITQWDDDANLEEMKHDFGDNLSPVIRKQLPTGLPDVRLRMTPSQIRSALPGIGLIRMSSDRQQGQLDAQNYSTDVALWDGLASYVGRSWEKVPLDQAMALHSRLMDEFGTPSERLPPVINQAETITWEDEQTKIVYMFSVMTDKSHHIQGFYYDKQLSALADASDDSHEQFKPAPDVHSFF